MRRQTQLLIEQHDRRRREKLTQNPCGEISLDEGSVLGTMLDVVSLQLEANMITAEEARRHLGVESWLEGGEGE